jgi:hypothetical protein
LKSSKSQIEIRNSGNVLEELPAPRAARGLTHNQMAQQFVAEFPLGTKLSISQFDDWAHRNAFLTVPPEGTSKNSDAWKAHIQRRHELRHNLNLASTHPRMDDKAFTLDKISEGPGSRSNTGDAMYEVRTPPIAMRTADFHKKIRQYTDKKFRTQFRYLMQSTVWQQLSDYERDATIDLYDDLRQFNDNIKIVTAGISAKIDRLCKRLAARESLKLNSAVQAILEAGDGSKEEV